MAFWFRKNLRLHDNPALVTCLKSCKSLLPFYIVEPDEQGPLPRQFRVDCLLELKSSMKELGTDLYIVQGDIVDILERINTTIYYQVDPLTVERDQQIKLQLEKKGIEMIGVAGHLLYDPNEIVRINKGKPPLTFTSFTNCVKGLKVPKPLDSPTQLPTLSPLPTSLSIVELESPATPLRFKGGEKEALKRLESYFEDQVRVARFEKPETSPAALSPSTTVLSPHLTHGSISPRLFYHRLMSIYQKYPNHSQPPTSLLGQLYWREFYYVVSMFTPNFNKMEGNPVCLQIDWWGQELPDPHHPKAQEYFDAWKDGKTGYPWIDAIMTQLRTQGWIHHLARHSVACFLTRGDLFISWERGAKVFEELLLDYDDALNAGNWMWLSASAFFHQYYRIYSPVAFGKKYDKKGTFIKHFLPILKDFPEQYIYEPWKAPLSVQQKAGCVIGQDYPFPIVEHETISKINMDKMKDAYAMKIKGIPGVGVPPPPKRRKL